MHQRSGLGFHHGQGITLGPVVPVVAGPVVALAIVARPLVAGPVVTILAGLLLLLGVAALVTGSQQAVETRRGAFEQAGQQIGTAQDINGSIDQNTQLQVQAGLTINELIGVMNGAV